MLSDMLGDASARAQAGSVDERQRPSHKAPLKPSSLVGRCPPGGWGGRKRFVGVSPPRGAQTTYLKRCKKNTSQSRRSASTQRQVGQQRVGRPFRTLPAARVGSSAGRGAAQQRALVEGRPPAAARERSRRAGSAHGPRCLRGPRGHFWVWKQAVARTLRNLTRLMRLRALRRRRVPSAAPTDSVSPSASSWCASPTAVLGRLFRALGSGALGG